MTIEMQPGEVIKEEIEENISSTISFCLRDWKEQWQLKRQPDYEKTDEPTYSHSFRFLMLYSRIVTWWDRYISDVFKEQAGGDLLYFMCVCTEDERTSAVEAMKMITNDTGIIEGFASAIGLDDLAGIGLGLVKGIAAIGLVPSNEEETTTALEVYAELSTLTLRGSDSKAAFYPHINDTVLHGLCGFAWNLF